jgi:hypothetical protein
MNIIEIRQRLRLPKILRLAKEFANHPVAVSRALPGEYSMRFASRQYRQTDDAWDRRLHDLLDAPWPCTQAHAVDEIMVDVEARLAANGIQTGHYTYGGYSDGEVALCRAAWCAAVHTRPEVVIETGVAHGVTSRIVLEALRQNEYGHLWSIDLPHPLYHNLHGETGVAVTDECRGHWSYLEGSSRQRLRPLIAQVGQVGMFIHDSLHTTRNTLFEIEQVASAMAPGGVMIVDDIEINDAFAIFATRHPNYTTIACSASDKYAHFGIAIKGAEPS